MSEGIPAWVERLKALRATKTAWEEARDSVRAWVPDSDWRAQAKKELLAYLDWKAVEAEKESQGLYLLIRVLEWIQEEALRCPPSG